MRANLYAVAAEDTAVEGEGVTVESSLGHHQRDGWTDLNTGPTGYAVGVVQAHIEGCRNDGVEALTEHSIAVGTNHIMAHTHALRTIDALVRVAQDEAVRQVHLVVVIVARFTIMEAVIGQSVLDAILLQVALAGSGAYTLQAATRLALSLFLHITHLNQFEAALALLIGQHGHLYLRLNRFIRNDIEEIRFALFYLQSAGNFVHIFTIEEGMNGARTQFTLCD